MHAHLQQYFYYISQTQSSILLIIWKNQMEDQRESNLQNSKSINLQLEAESVIQIQFNLSQKNWPFIKFSGSFKKTDPFLLIEQKIKNYHGSIKNLELFTEPTLKKKIDYHFRDKIESKLNSFHLISGVKEPKIVLFYKYDNGYEWPLLCSESFKTLSEKKQIEQ